ncbi:iron-containing alcohol dehydrogenase [Halosegnis sp.]|uniref:iron-containing alcohol dehydrogenase n=1 Tax=Halosegnis sp. TaxID=2864959 RepID=UPI0035D49930
MSRSQLGDDQQTATAEPRRFVAPDEVVVGRGAVTEIGPRMVDRGSRALIVTTEGGRERHGERVRESLKAAGLETVVYDAVTPDPTVATVEAGVDRYRTADCDCLVALGGGSPIDAAKAVAVLAGEGGAIREYATDRAGYEAVDGPLPPLGVVNTTAGTGSEATRSIVVTDEATATKFLVVATAVVPAVAVEDPELVCSLPPSHTAFTGIDAVTHAVEAYVSTEAWALSDAPARAAIRRLAEWLPVAWTDGDNLGAREATLVGQLQAGQAFTNASVALVHGMARPLGARLKLPHGLANAVLLPTVVDYSTPGAPERYAEVTRLLGAADRDTPDQDAADQAADALTSLCESVSVFGYLEEFGTVPDRATFAEWTSGMAKDALASGSPANNPRIPDQETIERLYLDVYDGVLAPHSA